MKKRFFFFLARTIGPLLIRLLGMTYRVTLIGREHPDTIYRNGGSLIYAFWHGFMFPLIYRHRKENIRVLVSRHADGEYIALILERLGYSTARGSSTTGGSRALLRMRGTLGSGCNFAFTPDGPRGPARVLKPGAVFFAGTSGLPLVPVAAAVHNKIVLNTWDGYIIPKPFSRVVIAYGEPLTVPDGLDDAARETLCRDIESRLSGLARAAEKELAE